MHLVLSFPKEHYPTAQSLWHGTHIFEESGWLPVPEHVEAHAGIARFPSATARHEVEGTHEPGFVDKRYRSTAHLVHYVLSDGVTQ